MTLRFIKQTSLILASCLLGLAATAASAEPTKYPLTLKNCNRTLTFTKAPESVVSVGQNSTEILYLLGLSNKVKGTALWFKPVISQFKTVNENIDVLSKDIPSFEAIAAKKPDLVASQYEWVIGPSGATAQYDQFDSVGIPVYTSPADCDGKDNMAGSDGLRTLPFSMDMIYKEIDELSQIFDVKDRGQKLIAELKAREQAAKDKVGDLSQKGITAVAWYSSADMEMDPYVAGQLGAPGYIFNTLGIKNVIESDHDWPMVGWETIVKANPTIIILAEMDRRRFPADDIAVKREFLKTDPVTSLMDAVKKDRLVVLDAQALNGSLHTLEALEILADNIRQDGIAK